MIVTASTSCRYLCMTRPLLFILRTFAPFQSDIVASMSHPTRSEGRRTHYPSSENKDALSSCRGDCKHPALCIPHRSVSPPPAGNCQTICGPRLLLARLHTGIRTFDAGIFQRNVRRPVPESSGFFPGAPHCKTPSTHPKTQLFFFVIFIFFSLPIYLSLKV